MLRYLFLPLSWFLILLVKLYQYLLSPFFGGQCRFYPSCSQYMILAIQKHGPFRGTGKGLWRLCKCHPWHPGGYDYP
ncbi:MAG: membrane protein insertion efficiency factor YidD [Gemmatales bacterium]